MAAISFQKVIAIWYPIVSHQNWEVKIYCTGWVRQIVAPATETSRNVDSCPWRVPLLTLLDAFLEPSPNSPNIFVVESSTAHRKHRVTSHDPMLLVWHCDHGGCTLPWLNCANQSWITIGITRPTSYPLVKMPEKFSSRIFQIFTISIFVLFFFVLIIFVNYRYLPF